MFGFRMWYMPYATRLSWHPSTRFCCRLKTTAGQIIIIVFCDKLVASTFGFKCSNGIQPSSPHKHPSRLFLFPFCLPFTMSVSRQTAQGLKCWVKRQRYGCYSHPCSSVTHTHTHTHRHTYTYRHTLTYTTHTHTHLHLHTYTHAHTHTHTHIHT